MAPELHTDLCPVCHLRPRGNQGLCRRCQATARVTLSDRERWMCQRLGELFGGLTGVELARTHVATERLASGLQPADLEERIWVGVLAWAYAEMLESHDLQDKDAETLYRKLMGHDRRTLQPAPFPLLSRRF